MLARSIIASILFASSGFGQMSMSSGAVDPSMTMASTMDPSMTMASTMDPSMTMDTITGSMMSSATSSIASGATPSTNTASGNANLAEYFAITCWIPLVAVGLSSMGLF
ncbi:hypothetical protein PV10_05281 [Exophiala mesophila]|uniref:Secreted protein n=1 Tax=Exophiala mesophila TaxID=212818 RepID=A0A0D1ZJM4_EXOME|nr:uncharacterized protein PV10_05281 [Exophiala mesophila]KIV94139.1 hypothetical protein PV10_05281 [Exophiala mesophila]